MGTVCNHKLLIPTKLLAEKPTDLPVSCQTSQECWLWKPQQTRTQDEDSTYKWWKFLANAFYFWLFEAILRGPIQKKIYIKLVAFLWMQLIIIETIKRSNNFTPDTFDGFSCLESPSNVENQLIPSSPSWASPAENSGMPVRRPPSSPWSPCATVKYGMGLSNLLQLCVEMLIPTNHGDCTWLYHIWASKCCRIWCNSISISIHATSM